jgi:hypothetical protein
MSESHFQKEHDRKSVLWRTSNYRSICMGRGFTAGSWEAHHILCNHAVADRSKGIAPADLEYVEDCLWITEWNLNKPDNLTGLPTNKQYRASLGSIPVNMPSHQVDHNTSDGYTMECKDWLKDNVWKTLKDKREPHEVTAKVIEGLLNDGVTHFTALLVERGTRPDGKGTKYCWDRRFPNHPEHVPSWYYPFSMGADPRPRHPGIDFEKLTNIFRRLF